MLPAAVPLSSYQLTYTYIPRELNRFQAEAKKQSNGLDATLQTDGWTGINTRHLLAFMMTTSARNVSDIIVHVHWPEHDVLMNFIYVEVHTVRVADTSNEQQTADHLRALIVDVMAEVERDWKVVVIAVTSDASGESRAARKSLLNDFPWLVTPDCYAHQVCLIFPMKLVIFI